MVGKITVEAEVSTVTREASKYVGKDVLKYCFL